MIGQFSRLYFIVSIACLIQKFTWIEIFPLCLNPELYNKYINNLIFSVHIVRYRTSCLGYKSDQKILGP